MENSLTSFTTSLIARYPKYAKIFFYILAGGMGAVTNIGLLFILTHYFNIYYVVSGIISFICSVFVSFTLQRTLTFKDAAAVYTHKQFVTFVTISIVNLGINTLLLFMFVEKLDLHYVLAQILASGLIAFWSYFAYKILVFKV